MSIDLQETETVGALSLRRRITTINISVGLDPSFDPPKEVLSGNITLVTERMKEDGTLFDQKDSYNTYLNDKQLREIIGLEDLISALATLGNERKIEAAIQEAAQIEARKLQRRQEVEAAAAAIGLIVTEPVITP